MIIKELIEKIQKGNRAPYLYHFTDTRNFPSIGRHGLRSYKELVRLGETGVIRGGNTWSFEQDERKGLDDFVHLCYFDTHPMAYHAANDGRIETIHYIKVLPSVLELQGVMFSDEVSNSAGAKPFPIQEVAQKLDLEILFEHTEWREVSIQERLKDAKKYEVLVPKHVPLELLRK